MPRLPGHGRDARQRLAVPDMQRPGTRGNMTRPGSLKIAQQVKKRTDAFAKFLVCRNKYQSYAGEVRAELEKSNKEMARLAEKFHWGSLP